MPSILLAKVLSSDIFMRNCGAAGKHARKTIVLGKYTVDLFRRYPGNNYTFSPFKVWNRNEHQSNLRA